MSASEAESEKAKIQHLQAYSIFNRHLALIQLTENDKTKVKILKIKQNRFFTLHPDYIFTQAFPSGKKRMDAS